MSKMSDGKSIHFHGTTIIEGDVVYHKIERESGGKWEHTIFYVNFVGKDGKTPKIWEQPHPNIRKSIWLAVQPAVMEFINKKCADGWELQSNLGDYDEILDFNTGTDIIRWIAEFVLKVGTTGLTDVNAYWTEARGARLHFRRKVIST